MLNDTYSFLFRAGETQADRDSAVERANKPFIIVLTIDFCNVDIAVRDSFGADYLGLNRPHIEQETVRVLELFTGDILSEHLINRMAMKIEEKFFKLADFKGVLVENKK